MRNAFAEIVKQNFGYLLDNYGFSVVDESYNPEWFGDALVEFQSAQLQVLVIRERGDVFLFVSPLSHPEYRFELSEIINFLAPNERERVKVYFFPDLPGEPEKSMDLQSANLARVLYQYGSPLLRGEFLQWKELSEFTQRQVDKFMKDRKHGFSDP